MRRSYKKLLFFSISLLFVMIAGLVGYVMARGEPRIVAAEPSPTAVAAGVEGASNSLIASGAVVTWVYEYDMCRHEITETMEADKESGGVELHAAAAKISHRTDCHFRGGRGDA